MPEFRIYGAISPFPHLHDVEQKQFYINVYLWVLVIIPHLVQCQESKKVKVSHNRPRWPKGFRVG